MPDATGPRSIRVRTAQEVGRDRATTRSSVLGAWGAHLPAALAYATLTALILWPAVVRFGARAMAGPADGSVFRWIWWSMPRAISDGRNPFTSDEIFHPRGADLSVTTSAPLVSALTWPVQAAFGQAAQVNTVQLGAMFLAGFAAYLLANHVCGDRAAAFLAGLAYALLPHRFVDVTLGHLNLVHLGALPLGLLAFVRFLHHPTRSRAVALGAIMGGTFLVEPQLLVLLVFAIAPLAVVHRRALRGTWRRLLGAGAVAIVVAAPLLVPMAAALTSGEAGDPAPTADSLIYSSSLLSWIVPPLDQLWIGHAVSLEPLTHTLEGIAYPGLVVLALALLGSRLDLREERRGWVAMTAVGVVLSFGPYPFVRGSYIELPLPFFLVRAVPGLDAFRVPGRFAVVGALGLAVLAASTLAALSRRHPRAARAIVAGACCITTIELLPRTLPESPGEVPEPYHAIVEDPNPGAVLEIPIQWSTGQEAIGFEGDRGQDFLFLINATVHQRPTVSGAASRYSAERFEELQEIGLYRQILALQGEPGFDDPPVFDAADLAAADIGFVAYDRSEPAPEVFEHLSGLGLSVLADDGTVIVWMVDERR